ncbi:MAG: DHH family phosphoesterase [Eubacteriales bacterium]|nr:DHH family phosphoesterase [Eubacteriales bacterium]
MEGRQKKSFRITGKMRSLFYWPFAIGILLILLDVSLCFINVAAASVMAVFLLIYFIIFVMMEVYIRPSVLHEILEISSNYSQVQRQLIYELSVPYCLLDDNGNVLWMNASMQACIDKKKDFNKNISTVIPELSTNVFRNFEDLKDIRVSLGERDYRIEMKRINADSLIQGTNIVEKNYDSSLVAMYMFDETDINKYIQKLRDERFVVGLVYIDNYEDALENVEDVKRSLIAGLVDKRVNRYFTSGAAIVRKMEKDKFLVVFKYKYLEKLKADKFSLVEDIKTVKIGKDKTITLSIGIGTGADDYSKNYDIAKAAMELALGRGGDQAVIKDGEKVIYYGGKSQQMEKNTRVKVRVKAHALRQILDANDSVLIMGHNIPDIDSFGSALGIYIIAKKLGKKAHIVFGEVTSSVRPFMNRFIDNDEYPDDMFIKKENAEDYITPSTVVIVVDVNKPQRTECPILLEKCKTVIVFDHHRSSSDTISGAVLSYVDPYASSACEMVTEMIQYVEDGIRLKAYEADALYAGINIDTDGFNSKSGPRTFEAAAFLRRHGADVTRVRKMLRNNMSEYRAVAEAVSKAEVYKNAFAITVFKGDGLESPTIGGAKAANQLLDISGIKASFVITLYEEKIFISARSIDEVNVQIIMEKLGGGGHMSIAGAQLKDMSIEDAIKVVKQTIDSMLAEGEI